MKGKERYSLIGTLIYGIAIFMGVAGVVFIVYGVYKWVSFYILMGLNLAILSVFALGFDYIVEAPYKFLDKEKQKEEKENKETGEKEGKND